MMTTARRHWWMICAGMLLGLVGATGVLAGTTRVYAATASVLVDTIGTASVNLPTEAQLARSTQTAVDAAAALHRPDAEVATATTIQALADSSVLLITFRASTPDGAQAGARAVATAYLANRTAAARSGLADQESAVALLIGRTTTEVGGLNAEIARPPASAAQLADLRSRLANASDQLSLLSSRLNDLQATTVNPGSIIGDPPRPARPVEPLIWLYLIIGAVTGALAGVGAAISGHKLSRRVRHSADVERRAGVAVLARLSSDERIGLLRDGGQRAFNRLRNEVMAAMGTDGRVILVTGVNPSSASTLVAANLAAAFARADTEVVLVGANATEPGSVPLSQVFDVADIPGLTDVLTGRVSLTRALQKAARLRRLRVIPPGGTATAAGLLQSEGARGAIQALRRQARYVVIEAPSTAAGADAQSLARVADAAILVVEIGRARHAQVTDAAQQLRIVGTRLLGAVLLGPVLPQSDVERPRPRAAHRSTVPVVQDDWRPELSAVLEDPTARLPSVPEPARAPTQS